MRFEVTSPAGMVAIEVRGASRMTVESLDLEGPILVYGSLEKVRGSWAQDLLVIATPEGEVPPDSPLGREMATFLERWIRANLSAPLLAERESMERAVTLLQGLRQLQPVSAGRGPNNIPGWVRRLL